MLVPCILPQWANKEGSSLLRRIDKAQLTISLTSLTWLSVFIVYGIASEVLPWCVTLALTVLAGIILSRKKQTDAVAINVKIGNSKPLSFGQSCASTYCLISLLLASWIVMHLLIKDRPQRTEAQVIDIELTSLADYQNKSQLLPSTKPLPTLRKSLPSPQMTLRGVNQMRPATVAQAKPVQSRADDKADKIQPKIARIASQKPSSPAGFQLPPVATSFFLVNGRKDPAEKQVKANDFVMKVVPPHVVATSGQKNNTENKQQSSQKQDTAFMEEVQPPEMIELVDNKGDQSLNVWQPGGHSANSTGERSELMEYLKELNKKIKSTWSPPGKQSHDAEVLFRIRDNGQLAFVKILRSSGDGELDASIVKAVVANAPFKHLPADYPLGFLDVKYTFDYKVDGMAETRNSEWQ